MKHEIVTGDSPPVRQPVRRVPFALREKVAGLIYAEGSESYIDNSVLVSLREP